MKWIEFEIVEDLTLSDMSKMYVDTGNWYVHHFIQFMQRQYDTKAQFTSIMFTRSLQS